MRSFYFSTTSMDTSGGDDAELQMALMMSLQAEDNNGENAHSRPAGKEKKPSAAAPLGQAAAENAAAAGNADNAGGDDCTPVGRDEEAAPRPSGASRSRTRCPSTAVSART